MISPSPTPRTMDNPLGLPRPSLNAAIFARMNTIDRRVDEICQQTCDRMDALLGEKAKLKQLATTRIQDMPVDDLRNLLANL